MLKACCLETKKPINVGGNWLIQHQPGSASGQDPIAVYEITGGICSQAATCQHYRHNQIIWIGVKQGECW